MATSLNHFYVTLFSSASRDIYEQNTHADFTMKLAQLVHLISTSNWELGVCEMSCASPYIEETPALIYCNLLSLQFVGDSTFRCTRTFVFHSATSSCQHEFRNVHYVQVEQRRFQDVRIEFLKTGGTAHPPRGQRYAHKRDASFSKELQMVIYKRSVGISNRTFITMHQLEVYYLNQAGRGLTPEIGPVYSATLYLHRGHGIGKFFRHSLPLGQAYFVERVQGSGQRDIAYWWQDPDRYRGTQVTRKECWNYRV